MKEELIVTAFRKALLSRKEPEMIVHSDRGGQYAGNRFRKVINDNKLRQSMSRADNPYDNAFMEFCFSRFKTELLQGGTFQTREDAQTELFEFIEMYYNTKRRYSALNYQSPMNYENNYYFYQPKATLLSGIFSTAHVSIRWVLIKDATGKKDLVALSCTNQELGVESIITYFIRRWALEVTFEERRVHVGIET